QPNFPYSIPPFGYPTDDNFSVFFSEEARYTVTLLGETGPIGGAEDAASYFYSFDSSLSSDTNHGSFGDRQTHIFLQGSEKGFILNETVTADISCSNMDYCSVGGPPDPNFVNIYSSQETNWGWGLSLMAPVPEPSTWAMLLIGFVGIGFMLYRRRRALVTVA